MVVVMDEEEEEEEEEDVAAKRARKEEEESGGRNLEPWQVDTITPGQEFRVQMLLVALQDQVEDEDFPQGHHEEALDHWITLLQGQGGDMLRTCPEHPWPEFHIAIMVGDLDAARALVSSCGTPILFLQGGCSGRTPLMVALRAGQYQAARWIWRRLPNAVKQLHRTELMGAWKLLALTVRGANMALLAWLLEEVIPDVARVTAQDLHGREDIYKLISAVFSKQEDEASCVAAISLLCRTPYLRSIALIVSSMKQCDAVARMLVACGTTVRASDREYLLAAMPPGSYVAMIRHLFSAGADLRHLPHPRQLIMHAIVAGSPELLEIVLSKGALHAPREQVAAQELVEDLDELEELEEAADPDDTRLSDHGAVWMEPLWTACLGVPPMKEGSIWSRIKVGTDHAVKMARLLLLHGASPFLLDGKGNRLVDALWCGSWWPHSSNSRNALVRPQFELEDNRLRLVREVKRAMCWWTPARHKLFPVSFRSAAFQFLLCNQRHRRSGQPFLPRVLIHVLMGWIAIAEAADETALRRALLSFNVNHLKSVLVEHGRDRRQVGKARKTVLVDLALQAKMEDEEATRRELQQAQALPSIIGRLVGRDEKSGRTFELDIVSPATQPWINIGRSFIKHPKGGATLDMDLSEVEYNRRISRLHATLRFNVHTLDWEVQVRGRNGLELDYGLPTGPEIVMPSHSWLSLSRAGMSFRMPFAQLSFQVADLVPPHFKVRPPLASEVEEVTEHGKALE